MNNERIDVLERAQARVELIHANAANSTSGFGTRSNRRQVFDWAAQAASDIYQARAAVAELIEREAALRESLRFIAQGHGCPAALATDTLARVQGGSK